MKQPPTNCSKGTPSSGRSQKQAVVMKETPVSPSGRAFLSAESPSSAWGLERFFSHSLELRSNFLYALHPFEAVVQHLRAQDDSPCDQGHGELRFEQAEVHYRAGAQGLRLSEIPQLPQQLQALSRQSYFLALEAADRLDWQPLISVWRERFDAL